MDRPFRYRDATKKLRREELEKFGLVDVKNKSFEGILPFKPVDIDKDIVNSRNGFDLISKCDIDMTNHPVWEFRGGESEALRKWNEFLQKGYMAMPEEGIMLPIQRVSHAYQVPFIMDSFPL